MHKSWKIQPTFNSFLLNSLLKYTSCNKFQWNVLRDVEMDHKWIFLRKSSELRHSNNNCRGIQWRGKKVFFCASRQKRFLINVTIYAHLAIVIREPQYRVHALISCAHVITLRDLGCVTFLHYFFSCFLRAKCLQSFHYCLKLSQCNKALHHAHIAPFSWAHIWLNCG